MKKIFLLLLITISSSLLFAQTPTLQIYDPPLPYVQNNLDWSGDLVVSQTEPFGRPSAVYCTTSSTLYAAIPDTNILAGKCIVIINMISIPENISIRENQPTSIFYLCNF